VLYADLLNGNKFIKISYISYTIKANRLVYSFIFLIIQHLHLQCYKTFLVLSYKLYVLIDSILKSLTVKIDGWFANIVGLCVKSYIQLWRQSSSMQKSKGILGMIMTIWVTFIHSMNNITSIFRSILCLSHLKITQIVLAKQVMLLKSVKTENSWIT